MIQKRKATKTNQISCMMVKINNIDRTCLDESAYKKVIWKYSTNLMHDVLIVFDGRLKDQGSWFFKKKKHIIRICPSFADKSDKVGSYYHLISTTLHELRHAQQYEEQKKTFWNKKFSLTEGVKDPTDSRFFSKCEIDARIYENQNIVNAVAYYLYCLRS